MTLHHNLTAAIAIGQVLPGDCILYRYSRLTPTQQVIARIQSRALLDLESPVSDTIDSPSMYTHAGMVFDQWGSVEMTSPRCRRISWTHRLVHVADVLVIRPVHENNPLRLRQAAVEGYEDVLRRVRYPYRELMIYWLWSWGWRKLGQGGKFEQVFRSHNRNVCSGAVIAWWTRAGVSLGLTGLDTYHESWYPARLAVDPRFRLVVHIACT